MEQIKYNLSPEERETIILYSDASKECTVYTCSRPLMTKLDKLCKSNPNEWQLSQCDGSSKTYITTKSLISFRSKKQKTILTDEQRKKASLQAKRNFHGGGEKLRNVD